MTLSPGVEFGGRVTDEADRPLAEVEVAAQLKLAVRVARRTSKLHFYSMTAATDSDGRFRLAKLPPDAELQLEVRHPQYVTFRRQDIDRGHYPIKAGDGPIDIQLSLGASIEGRLLADGKAFEQSGVLIQATDPDNAAVAGGARTDAMGRYRITGLETRRYVLHAALGQKLPSDLVVSPLEKVWTRTGQTVTADLACSRGVTVAGRVTDPAGRGVQQPIRAALASMPNVDLFFEGTHDDGRYRLLLPPGDYHLKVADLGLPPSHNVKKEVRVGAEVPGSVDFQVSTGATLRTRLIDTRGAAVLGNVKVYGNWNPTDIDGKFSHRYLPAKVTRACWAISADKSLAAGFYWLEEMDDLPAPVVLRQPATVAGQVVDGDGRKVTSDMFVYYWADATGTSDWAADVARARIDDDGKFEIRLPTGVRLGVSVFSDGYEQAILPPTDFEPGQMLVIGKVRLPPRSERPAPAAGER